MTTMRNDVVYEVSVNGADEAARSLGGMAQRTAHGVGVIADNIKTVGKDLDNLGLNAGKTFAMTVEGALSVVTALGTGGVAGVVGAVTVGVGYLAQAWANSADEANKAKEAAEKAMEAEEKRWAAAASRASEFLGTSQSMTIEFKRRALVEQAAYLVELEKAIEEEQQKVISGEVETGQRLLELRATYAAEEADGKRMADEFKTMQQEAADKAEIEELEKQLREKLEMQKKAAEKIAADEKKAAEELERQRSEYADAAARRAAFENEVSNKYAMERYNAERKRIEDKEKADEDAAKKAQERLERQAEKDADAEKRRREEIEKTTKALREKQQADAAAAMAAAYSTQVNLAFSVSSTVVQPVISELTGTIRELGEVNRDTYQDFVLFSDELPAIIAKKTQAILGGIAAEATGKSLQSVADSAREFALGSGLIAIPGMQAQAAGHFTSSAAHMVAASAYAAIGGAAASGAIGIGAMRGSGGPIPLTREEQDRNASRDRNRGGGGGSLGGGSRTSMGAPADGGAFVVNIAYQAGSIAPADEARAARTVASATRRARSNAFDRRRMEG